MNLTLSRLTIKHLFTGLAATAMLAAATLMSTTQAHAETLRIGAPSWPGVTVKSNVAQQILEAMGYDIEIQEASPAFIITGLKNGDMDIYLGGWMPTEEDLINPPKEKGEVKVLATNISDAILGLAVPSYVWDAGVHKVTDLNKFADKFDHKIYGIEDGSGFNNVVEKAIKNDLHNLGEWELVPSTTSIMLAQVKNAIKHKDWIVYLGWEPHWMNIVYDMKYLEPVDEPILAGTHSDVLTVVNPKMAEKYPDIEKFLSQFVVTTDEQSEWVYQFSHKERPEKEVASEWIQKHMERVAEWLDGVKDSDGNPAIDLVKKAFN